LYTAKELVDAGAQMIMLDLWERPWLTELVKLKDNTTSGEIKREYQKLFGIV
jgi:nicotinate-nucleotide pyrophosphorylase